MSHNKINLFFSHSVESLANVLSKQVNAQQTHGDIFNAPKVLVPNANMQRYLQLAMAKNNGVCAHVDFPFLECQYFKIEGCARFACEALYLKAWQQVRNILRFDCAVCFTCAAGQFF